MSYRHPARKPLLSAIACASLSLAPGCSSEAPAPPPAAALPAGEGRTLGELGFDSGELARDGTPIYLGGQVRAGVRSGADARRLLLGELRQAFRLSAETELEVVSEQRDRGGLRYVRLAQRHRGVPVVGAEVVVQAGPDGTVTAVLGQLTPDLRLEVEPALEGDGAVRQALRGLATGASRILAPPALQVLVGDDGTAALCWRALVEYVGQDGYALEEVFADARDGALRARHSRLYRAIDRRVHDLKGRCVNSASLPGALGRGEGDAAAMDEAVNAAFDNTGSTYWFYWHLLGRDSFDDAGAAIVSTVNMQFPGLFSCTPNNAAWLSSPYNQMAYGSGDGGMFKNFALSMDVTAHELTHAVTSRSSNLTYRNESGALNEAMSDILGAGAEAWVASGGGVMGNPATLAATAETWKIGETIAGIGVPGGALRFMNNPTADNYSKDYYPERLTGPSDNGGVHGNSGIANLAFYLLSEGGKHPRNKTTVQVSAIGLERALQIFYLANNRLFTASTDFRRARYATAVAAQTLYGRCSDEWTNVHRAWDAVGVPGTWSPCVRPPTRF